LLANRGGLFVHVRPELLTSPPPSSSIAAAAPPPPPPLLSLVRPPRRRSGGAVGRAATWAGSALAVPALGKTLLLVAPATVARLLPVAAAAALESYAQVWRAALNAPGITYRFLGAAGLLEVLAVAAMNGVLAVRGKAARPAVEATGAVLLAAASAAATFTHVKLGEPCAHAVVLGALFLAKAVASVNSSVKGRKDGTAGVAAVLG
jgi:hypothetical protein